MFKKKILPLLVFLLLLCGMAYFPYLPMLLFRIPYDNFSMSLKLLYMFFCDIGYMVILFLLYKRRIRIDFRNYFKNFRENFELAFKYYFVGLLIMIVSNFVIAIFFSGASANNEEAVRSLIGVAPLYMIFSVSLYAPFVEELIFRKSIKDIAFAFGKNKITKYGYIFMSGFIFALMHILGQVTSTLDYLYVIPYMSLGVAFAALYHKTDNIFASISMHALHNTVTILLYFAVGGVL